VYLISVVAAERDLVHALERKNAHDLFISDPYGVRPPLSSKRQARLWDERCLDIIGQNHPPVIHRLLRWDGGNSGVELFDEALPWHAEELEQ
jgi:hypothetical protein